jgi:putative sigma-54 modulation protein
MKWNIRGRGLSITPALSEYVEKKIGRIESWFPQEIRDRAEAHVILSLEGHGQHHKAEVTVLIGSLTARGEVKSEDMYASIDAVVEKLERQVHRHKTKFDKALRRRGGLRSAVNAEPAQAVATAEGDEPYPIVRIKRIQLKPIDVDEAILQMNLLDHQFYLFLNRDTNETELVYRRSDGTYGWLTR